MHARQAIRLVLCKEKKRLGGDVGDAERHGSLTMASVRNPSASCSVTVAFFPGDDKALSGIVHSARISSGLTLWLHNMTLVKICVP